MKKFIIPFILFSFLIGCTQHKTINDLEIQSLKSGFRTDSIFYPFFFGMSRDSFYNYLSTSSIILNDYHIAVPDLCKFNFKLKPFFFDDSLYMIELSYGPEYDADLGFSDAIDIYTKKYANPDTIIDNKYYWFRGNKEISIENNIQEEPSTLIIQYIDLLKDTISNCIYPNSIDALYDKYSHKYYQNIYLPREEKKQKSDLNI